MSNFAYHRFFFLLVTSYQCTGRRGGRYHAADRRHERPRTGHPQQHQDVQRGTLTQSPGSKRNLTTTQATHLENQGKVREKYNFG